MTSAKEGDIQFEFMMGFGSASTIEGTSVGIVDLMLGGASFPEDPIFSLGDTPVRLKITALGGWHIGSGFSSLLRMDLVFAGRWDTSGLMMGFGLRPGVETEDIVMPSEVTFSVGFMFMP